MTKTISAIKMMFWVEDISTIVEILSHNSPGITRLAQDRLRKMRLDMMAVGMGEVTMEAEPVFVDTRQTAIPFFLEEQL